MVYSFVDISWGLFHACRHVSGFD